MVSPVPVAFYPATPPFSLELWQADARNLSFQPAESVHCVVTSPPYWGLRDYGLGSDALGLESTIDLYVQHIVEVFREVRRVLRKDGTFWLVLGDSYAGSGKGQMGNGQHSQEHGTKQGTSAGTLVGGLPTEYGSLKPKDLCGIPWRVAFALQADGWWLRSDIVWSKPNPMPESVTDRPTRAHEYLFLLTKAERYYYDADAIREPHSPDGRKMTAAPLSDGSHANYKGADGHERWPNGGRNKRSVWHLATQPYKGAHFATFPEKLVEPCILAGTSERGVCPDCGAPWERVVDRTPMEIDRSNNHPPELRTRTSGTMTKPATSKTISWRASCACGHEDTVPATVLDPFAGSGTVGIVANQHGRRAILVDLNAEYCTLAIARLEKARA